MSHSPKSQNFEFLRPHEELLAIYALHAERYVFSDPNTCFLKLRQYGELMAKVTAHRAGLACSERSFDETLNLLRRQNVIHSTFWPSFYEIKRLGNKAAHEHEGDQTAALQCLISAHDLANWFMKFVIRDTQHRIKAFQSPNSPHDATSELKQEIELLREKAARAELKADASLGEIQDLIEKHKKEIESHELSAILKDIETSTHKAEIRRLQKESDRKLKELIPVAESNAFWSFFERSTKSAERLGANPRDVLPLTQLRITTGRRSNCCDVPMVLAQQMKGGFIKQCCPVCNEISSTRALSRADFQSLNVHVECPYCHRQAEPYLNRNYLYRCFVCDWECELASLVPNWSDLGGE